MTVALDLVSAAAAALADRLGEAVSALGRVAALARGAGPLPGATAALAGVLVLALAGRFRRVLAGLGGAAVGALAALALRSSVAAHVGLSPVVSVPLLTAVAAAGCALFPAAFPFLAGALPGALLGVHAPIAGRAAMGGAVGGLAAGVVALVFARPVGVAVVSLLGGLLLALGLVAIAGRSQLGAELTAHPFALLAVAVVTGIAGAAFQLARGEAPSRGQLEGPGS